MPSDPVRPDYICCVTAPGKPLRVYCGRPALWGDWRFTGPAHAQASILTGTRVQPCPECVTAMPHVPDDEVFCKVPADPDDPPISPTK